MGGVGDEPAQLGLGGLPGGEGSLHVAQHPVEGGGQLRHLMIGVHSRVGDGSRDADLAMVQVQLRDCRGRRRQGPQGFRRGVGDGPGREGRRHHRHHSQPGGQYRQPHDGGVEALERQGDDHQVAGDIGVRDGPVPSPAREVDVVLLPVGLDPGQGFLDFDLPGDPVVVCAVADLRSLVHPVGESYEDDGARWYAGSGDALGAAVLLAGGEVQLQLLGVVDLRVEL